MFPYRPIHPIPPDEDVCGDDDLRAHRVRLAACCDAFDSCEDVVLHVALHSTEARPTVEHECELRANLSTAIKKKCGVFRKWDQRRAVFGKSRYVTATAVANGLKRGDIINDPLVLDLISHQCLAHITLYGRHTTWSTTMGNADFVPVKLACMRNGMLHPVKNCESMAVQPAKSVPCCTVTSGDAVCDQAIAKESQAVSVVRGVLDDLINEVVMRRERSVAVVSALLDKIVDVVVPQTEGEVQSGGHVLRSANKKVSVPITNATTTRQVSDDQGCDEICAVKGTRKCKAHVPKKLFPVQTPVEGKVACDPEGVMHAKKIDTSQSRGDNVMQEGSLVHDLMRAFQESFPDDVVSSNDPEQLTNLRDVSSSCEAVVVQSVESHSDSVAKRSMRKRDAKMDTSQSLGVVSVMPAVQPVSVAKRSMRKRNAKMDTSQSLGVTSVMPAVQPVSGAKHSMRKHDEKMDTSQSPGVTSVMPAVQPVSDSDDDIPLSSLFKCKHSVKRAAKPVSVSVTDATGDCSGEGFDSDDDIPLSSLFKRKRSVKRAAKPVSVSVTDATGDCSGEGFDSDDDIPLSRMVKCKLSVKRTKCRSFTCVLCSAHFRSHCTMKGHLVKKHKCIPCWTTYCYEHFLTVSNRDAHEAVHKVQKYVCDDCKTLFQASICA